MQRLAGTKLKLKAMVAVALLLFVLSFILHGSTCDQTVFLAVNQWSRQWSPIIWSCLTILGDTYVAVVILVPCLWWRPTVLVNFWLALPMAGATIALTKRLVAAPRPAGLLEEGSFQIIGPVLQYNAYPSGHTLTAFAMLALVLVSSRFWVVWLVGLTLGFGVAVSRIAVGAHWPADVVAGAALGWLCGVSAHQLGGWVRRRYPKIEAPPMLATMAVVWLALSVYLLGVDTAYPLANPLQWSIALAAAASGLLYLGQRVVARRAGSFSDK